MIRLLWVFDKNACSEACAIPILVKPINREIYYKNIGTAMPSSSLAKLAARPRTVSLPPAKPSIKNRDSDAVPLRSRSCCAVTCRDLAAGCAVDWFAHCVRWLIDGLIRFLSHTSHECSDCHVESVSNFTEVRKTDISSSDLYRGVVRPVHADAIRKLYLRVTRLWS